MKESLKYVGRNLVRMYALSPFRGKTRLRTITDRWLAPQGNIERVRVGPCVIDLDHRYEATRNMAYGVYERHEVALLRRLLKPGDVSVDVGANVGYLSAHMAQCVGPAGTVYRFRRLNSYRIRVTPEPTATANVGEISQLQQSVGPVSLSGMRATAMPAVVHFLDGLTDATPVERSRIRRHFQCLRRKSADH